MNTSDKYKFFQARESGGKQGVLDLVEREFPILSNSPCSLCEEATPTYGDMCVLCFQYKLDDLKDPEGLASAVGSLSKEQIIEFARHLIGYHEGRGRFLLERLTKESNDKDHLATAIFPLDCL